MAGDHRCPLLRAVGDEDGRCALLQEMARRKVGHLPCPNEEDRLTLERAEDLAGQLDGDRGDGDGAGPDLGFGADAFGESSFGINACRMGASG